MKKWWYLLICFLIVQNLIGQITYQTTYVDYDSAWQFRNLKIIPIRKKGPASGKSANDIISLQQGLKSGVITLSERGSASTENVHWLRVNNSSKKSVFIGSGEVVIGGRQDRMVTKDTLLVPNGKDQYISVMCVEEGRWSDKEKRFIYGSYANPRLRKVLDQTKNQVRIWREISNQLDSCNIKSPTLAYTAPHVDKRMGLYEEEYLRFFLEQFRNDVRDSTIVGFVGMSGDKIIGCDAFSANNLFRSSLEALLQGYIEEALRFGKVPVVTNDVLKSYMDRFMTDEKTQEIYLKRNGKIYKYGDEVIHLTAY